MPGFFGQLQEAASRALRAGQGATLSNRATQVFDRYVESQDAEYLDQAIQLWSEAAGILPDQLTTELNRDMQLYIFLHLGAALCLRSDRTGSLEDLNQAILCMEKAYAKAGRDSPKRGDIVINYSGMLTDRYFKHHDEHGLDKAVELAREGLNISSRDQMFDLGKYGALCASLGLRYTRDGNLNDLDESIKYGRKALGVQVDYENHSHYVDTKASQSRVINSFTMSLWNNFKARRRVQDIREAIGLVMTAMNATPVGHPDKFMYTANLGGMFHDVYRWTGLLSDLDSAILYTKRASDELVDRDPSSRGALLGNLSTCLGQRYRRNGEIDDLAEAIEIGKKAVKLIPINDENRPNVLYSNGMWLAERFDRIGAMEDLDTAIVNVQEALRDSSSDFPKREMFSDGLSTCLLSRYLRTSMLEDLNESIRWGEEAQRLAITDGPFAGSEAANLCCALWNRSCIDTSSASCRNDLDRAFIFARRSLELMPVGHPNRAYALLGLGQCQQSKYEIFGQKSDLDKAIETAEESVQTLTPNQPEHAKTLNRLGMRYLQRYKITHGLHDLTGATTALVEAAEMTSAQPMIRVKSARSAGSTFAIREEWSRAYEMLKLAVDLVPRVSPRIISKDDQQDLLSEIPGISSLAGSVALAAGRSPAEALSILEAGRTLMASMSINAQSDESDLASKYPVKHQKYLVLRDRLTLATPQSRFSDPNLQDSEATAAVTRRMSDLKSLEAIEHEIRGLDGFKNFQLPLEAGDFMKLAEQGPIVEYNASKYRTDAFIVTSTSIEAVRLGHLGEESVMESMNLLIHPEKRITRGELSTLGGRNKHVAEIFKWLWDFAVSPVLNEIQLPGPNTDGLLPRIWWVTSGLLGLAPFHAAGEGWGQHRENTASRVVSCYISSFKALRYARERALKNMKAHEERFLGVCMSDTPGACAPLPQITARVKAIQLMLNRSGIDNATNSPMVNPCKADVLSALNQSTIVHFGCHGLSDATDPSSSALVLRQKGTYLEDLLSVRDLRAEHLQGVQLAYLSACSTAENSSVNLRDETIHLASAFQLVGFPHVVGTFWEADVDAADNLADLFYKHWLSKTLMCQDGRVAYALHDAVDDLRAGRVDGSRRLRNASANVITWAPFMYMGC